MKIREVKVEKQFKFGLPNFSNITASAGMTVELGENEQVDWDSLWDTLNQQLWVQSDIDPSWLKIDEFRNHFRLTFKQKKGIPTEG